MRHNTIAANKMEPQLKDLHPSDRPSPETQITQLWMLLDVSRVLNSTLDLDTLLRIIVEVATVVTESEAASILLLDQKTGELHFEAATGTKRSEVQSIVVPIEGSIAGWIVSNSKPLLVNNAQQDPRHYTQADDATEFETRSLMGVPLKLKEKTIGVVEVVNKIGPRLFTKHDVEILETLAAQAAVAIENARLYTDLQDQMQALQQAQARLVQSEKLAAVGELVAGVAHELNNPLTSIIGFVELLQLNDLNDSAQKDLDRVVVQAQRAAGIVRGLLDFARQHPPERTPVQIHNMLNKALDLLAYELRTHNIVYDTHFVSDMPLTMADPHQFQQVFINLINNARQAMSGAHSGGRLTITTQLGPSLFRSPDKKSNNQSAEASVIRVIIQDTGPGIPSDRLSRIFDPFFTTKQPGEGTGLGLSVCHGIVSEHGGHIWAESELEKGSVFFIEIPIIELEKSRWTELVDWTGLTDTDTDASISDDGAARLLVIDDEPDLLELLSRTLKLAGFEVDTTGDGHTALTRLNETNYDLIVCDVRMPGMSGLEIFEQAQQQRPDLAKSLIFMTGDTVSPATRRLLDETGAPYLAKPFKPDELIQKVRGLLKAR